MSMPVIGVIGICILIVLLLLRIPIAFAMLITGTAGYCILVSPKAGLALLGLDLFSHVSMYTMTVIPMFVLAGSIAYIAGMGERLFSAAYAVAGRLPGSLYIATTLACAGFGAICGSSSAAAATMGKVALPSMRKFNYDKSLSTGSIAAAGTLAVMIPPSTVFIGYAILTDTSVGKLFVAGILPGILLTFLFALTVLFLCLRNPSLAPAGPKLSAREKLAGALGVSETIILFALVIGGLSLGWFSPTQGGGILVAGVTLVALIRRQLHWREFVIAIKDTAKISCMIIFIVASALIFGRFMAVSRLPFVLADILGAFSGSPLIIMVIIMLVYIIGGCFMDSLALATLTIPIIYPAVLALNFDPIWFGVMICALAELGMITPPVGITVFVIKGIAEDIPLGDIFRGAVPFMITIVICLIILIIFPEIALFLPRLISY